jgi:alkaline phosphatase D
MTTRKLPVMAVLLSLIILLLMLAATPTSQAIQPGLNASEFALGTIAHSGVLTFTHGIASGDVSDTSARLWTRVNQTATLTLEVSLEPDFNPLAYTDTIPVSSTTDFTALITAQPLQAGATHYYRWRGPATTSPVGKFNTAPMSDVAADLRFAFSGDSDGTLVGGQTFYNNFEVLDSARLNDPDFFVYLGDIVYADSPLRPSPATTLPEYRETYKENRLVQALPDFLASTSTYAIWDDHEVMNDFDGQTVNQTLYKNGRQALLEYMPIGDAGLPSDPSCAADPLFRQFSWGSEADIIILDERSCRSADVESSCYIFGDIPDPVPALPPEIRQDFGDLGLPANPPTGCLDAINDPSRTFLGPVQKQLFMDALLNSSARWKIVVNELPIQQFFLLPYDRWEGYAAERAEIINFIRDNHIENVVFVTADTHANLANQVYVDFFSDPQPVAEEFVTGPIATSTLEDAILSLPITGALEAVNDLFDFIGMDCRNLDAYSYGLVDINAANGLATISFRDDTGAILVDSSNPLVSCARTLGYDTFIPALSVD